MSTVEDAYEVPAGWETRRGSEIAALIGKGSSPRWQGFAYSDSGMLFVTSENVRDGYLDVTDPKFLPLEFHEKLARTQLRQDDILVNLVGASIGRSCRVAEDLGPANVNQAVAVVRLREPAGARFIAYFLQAPSTVKRILDMQADAARPNISLGNLRDFAFLLPPLPEQRAIAAALSDVDALIAALDQLIAKKRDLKTATMQQLLTGQRRLPGFTGAWETKRLGARGAFSKGKGIRKDEVLSDGLACLRYGEIYTHHDDVLRRFFSFVSRDVARGSVRLRKGDIVFAGSGETAEEIGKCVAFVGDTEAYVGSDTIVFNPTEGDPVFLAYVLNHVARVVAQKARMGQGDAVVHISAKNLATLEFAAPETTEQAAIGRVLLDIDDEIAAIAVRREKTRLIKQGMMQELLTGRTRLVAATT